MNDELAAAKNDVKTEILFLLWGCLTNKVWVWGLNRHLLLASYGHSLSEHDEKKGVAKLCFMVKSSNSEVVCSILKLLLKDWRTG